MLKESEKKPKKKFGFKKVLIGIGIVLVVLFGLAVNEVRKMKKMREAFQVQREAQVSFWKEQGLSEEEIEEKLSELRGGQMGEGRVSGPAIGVMRVFGRITGGRGHP